MPIRHTERGFADYAEFNDSHGARVRVCQSSAASEPKVWICVDKPDVDNHGAIHLTVEQTERLVVALQEWLTSTER